VNLVLNIAQQEYPSRGILGIMLHRSMFLVSMLSAGASLLQAQAMIEFGTVAGRGGAANAGKSIVDVFGKVQKSLDGATKVDDLLKPSPLPVVTAAPVAKASVTAVTPQATPEPVLPPDLKELVMGMERADMLKKVGKPWMSISSVESGVLVETCSYRSGGDSIMAILRDGKVATISGLEKLTAK
jgi:hypothetical protein